MRRLAMAIAIAGLSTGCSLTLPVSGTSNVIGNKVGRSSATCVLGICLDGDAGAFTAAKNGGITKISTIDYRKRNYLWIVQIHECIVSGE